MRGLVAIVPSTLAAVLAASSLVWAGESRTVSPDGPIPQPVSGVSGGPQGSDCGNIAGSPNLTLQVDQDISSMTITMNGGSSSTLRIDGPGGQFCILADGSGQAQFPGYWTKGTYFIHVGDRAGSSPFQLSIVK